MQDQKEATSVEQAEVFLLEDEIDFQINRLNILLGRCNEFDLIPNMELDYLWTTADSNLTATP